MNKIGVKSVSFHTSFLKSSLIVLILAVSSPFVAHAFDLTVTQTAGGPGKTYTLSWTAVTKATDTSLITYCAYEQFGYGVSINPAHLIKCVLDITTLEENSLVGTRTFIVTSSDSFNGATEISNPVAHSFVHTDPTGNLSAGILRADGDGTQRGVDQIWKFTFKMDDDAYLTMGIYPPGTIFTTDVFGFVISASAAPVKVLVSSTPRSGELADGSAFASNGANGDDEWDCRSSSGQIVGNGIYYLLVQATLDPGQRPAYLESPLREGITFTIPVDILRIINLQATGITPAAPTSNITYTLTGDSLVRFLVAKPGSHFTVDGNGDIQPINAIGVIDPTLIVSTKTYQRKAGAQSETWDGTSSTGTVMPSGVYAVGISAKDEYGNHAIDNTGNDAPVFTTLTLERDPTSVGSGNGATPDTTPPVLTSILPSDGSTVYSQVSTITIVLTDGGGSGLVVSQNSFSVKDSLAITPPFSYSFNQSSGAVTLTFSPPLDTNGLYTITINVADVAGNKLNVTKTFNLDVSAAAAARSIQDTLKIFPNPATASEVAKNGTCPNGVCIQYDLGVASDIDIDIFNVAGERVNSFTYSDAAANGINHTWALNNSRGQSVGSGLYIVRIKSGGVDIRKKVVVVR